MIWALTQQKLVKIKQNFEDGKYKMIETDHQKVLSLEYSNIPHIRNSIFHLRPKSVSYNTRRVINGNYKWKRGSVFLIRTL